MPTYSLGLIVHSSALGCPATWESPGDKRQEGFVSGFGSDTLQEVFGRVLNCSVGPAPQASVPGPQLPCSRARHTLMIAGALGWMHETQATCGRRKQVRSKGEAMRARPGCTA